MQHQQTATRRTKVIIGHILSKRQQTSSPIAFETTGAELVEAKLHINELKTSQADFTIMQDDFNFRPYVSGKDDAAFKALDYICYQGEKTKLISEFVLKHPWESIQPRGSSLVAEDYKGDVAGVARSYIYDCTVNGQPSSNSYVFLIRVHPDYRRMSLAVYLTGRLFYRDVTEADVQYMTSWVVVDNTPSLGLQDRIASVGKEAYGMPESETIGSYRCVGTYLDSIVRNISNILQHPSAIIRHFTESTLCGSIVTSKYKNSQFFPHDIDSLFSSPLSLGVYTISKKNSNNTETIMASICVWNSGEVRITAFRNSDFRSDGAVLLHNAWFHPSQEGQEMFLQLLHQVCQEMKNERGFKFVNMFLPDKGNNENHDLYIPVVQLIEKEAKINVTWRARVWYVRNKTKLNMIDFPDVFYDPRQSLI